jgi:hypothetical protein
MPIEISKALPLVVHSVLASALPKLALGALLRPQPIANVHGSVHPGPGARFLTVEIHR